MYMLIKGSRNVFQEPSFGSRKRSKHSTIEDASPRESMPCKALPREVQNLLHEAQACAGDDFHHLPQQDNSNRSSKTSIKHAQNMHMKWRIQLV